ncbi:MAG: O-antigen ligase family protein [Paracoccaceae bacterium]
MTSMIVQPENRAILMLGAGTIALSGLLVLLRLPRIALPPGGGWALTLNLLALLSALWSPLPELTLKRAAGLSGATLIAIHLYSVYRWRDIERGLVWTCSGLVVVTAVIALVLPGYAYHQPGEFYAEHAGMLRGSYVHKNSLARILTFALVVIVCLGPRTFRKRRVSAGLAVATLFLIGMTGSATALVTLPAAFGTSWLLFRARSLPGRIFMLAAVGYVVVLISASGIDEWLRGTLLEGLGRDATMSGRTLIWQSAIDYTFKRNQWLLGGGYETAWQAGIGDYVQSRITFNPGHPHNGYIALFNQIGILGLIIAALHLTRCFWRILRQADPVGLRLSRFSMTWLILFVANNSAGSYFMQAMDIYWVIILLTPALGHWARRDDGMALTKVRACETRSATPAGLQRPAIVRRPA